MKFNLISIAVLASLGMSTGAQADLFTFNPGTGNITDIALIDQAPGSAIAQGGVSAIQNFASGGTAAGNNFQLYYQANLSNMQAADTTPLFSNGTGGNFFNFVASFGETVTSVAGNNSATFAFNPGSAINYFEIFASSSIANNLTGAGFGGATSILKGVITSVDSSNFVVSSVTPVNLDQSPNGNQWGTQQTVTGSGSSDITVQVTSVDGTYFPTLNPLNKIVISFFNTSQVDPYKQVDPSRCFNTLSFNNAGSVCDGVTGGADGYNGVLGALNGSSGPDFQFQADANQSITQSVPEPGTVAMVGLGLTLLGLGGVRRRKAAA